MDTNTEARPAHTAGGAEPGDVAQAPESHASVFQPLHPTEDRPAVVEEYRAELFSGRVVPSAVIDREPTALDVLRPAAATLPMSPPRSQPRGDESTDRGRVVVTIGRIEVRASPAAAPPPAAPPRKPAAVSLEEYLRPRRRNP